MTRSTTVRSPRQARRGVAATALALVLGTALGAGVAVPAAAQEAASPGARLARAPQLSVSATAYRDVPQDRITVTLYVERESAQPAAGQAQVSELLGPVLARLKARSDLEVQGSGYRTDPVWQQSRIVAWRTRGGLDVSAAPSEAFNQLIGELATRLNVQSVAYSLSRDARLAVEHELIAEAVGAFRAKAGTGARALGFRGYTVRDVSIGDSGPMRPEPVPKMMMARASEAAPVPLPAAEGKTAVSVTVSGSVTLEP